MQLVIILKKGKRLVKKAASTESNFKEIKIESKSGKIIESSPCAAAEIIWKDGQIIKFSQVDLLLEFLKKAAWLL
jgi:hypothetical protein